MKLYFALLALTFTLVSAVNSDGFTAWPYCFSVTDGQFIRDGEVIPYVDYANKTLGYWGPSNAVYIDGLNFGLDVNAYWAIVYNSNASFLVAKGNDANGTLNPFPYDAAYWDFGIAAGDGPPYEPAYGLVDGTLDTVDLGMAVTIDLNIMPFRPDTYPQLLCTDNGVELSMDNLVNELTVVQHFYAAKQYNSWGRAVAVFTNPTNADITALIGFYNNMGTDDYTLALESNSNYVVIAEATNDTALNALNPDDEPCDNPVSLHWSSQGSSYPSPSVDEKVDIDFVNFYWNVTIKAGETQSFMMILVQNRYSVQETLDNATYVNSNPLNIYQGLSSDILSTIQNFNVCAATAPIVTVTETSSCTTAGGEATLAVVDYDLSFAIVVYDNTGAELTNVDDVVMVPEGDYMVVARLYPGCEVTLKTGSVTCTVAPTTAPSSNTPQASTPTSVPKSATSTATTYNGVTAVAMSLIALASLL